MVTVMLHHDIFSCAPEVTCHVTVGTERPSVPSSTIDLTVDITGSGYTWAYAELCLNDDSYQIHTCGQPHTLSFFPGHC